MKKIEISSLFNLDEIRYGLQSSLNTKDLVKFACSLSDNLTEEEEFWKLLKKECNNIKLCCCDSNKHECCDVCTGWNFSMKDKK